MSAYQKDNGKWYELVEVDSFNSFEREVPGSAKAPAAEKPVPDRYTKAGRVKPAYHVRGRLAARRSGGCRQPREPYVRPRLL